MTRQTCCCNCCLLPCYTCIVLLLLFPNISALCVGYFFGNLLLFCCCYLWLDRCCTLLLFATIVTRQLHYRSPFIRFFLVAVFLFLSWSYVSSNCFTLFSIEFVLLQMFCCSCCCCWWWCI